MTTTNPIAPGTIYVSTWGFDQTNVDFYEVIASSPQFVTVHEIGREVIETLTDMSEAVIPRPDTVVDEWPMRRKIRPEDNNAITITAFITATPWDGQPCFRSTWA